MVRQGQVHPRELVEICLRRIDALDPQLNAFRTVLGERALAEASRAQTADGLLAGGHEAHARAGAGASRGWRLVGAVGAGVLARVSADQRGAHARMGALLRALGHDVVERHPDYRLAQLGFVQMWMRGIYEHSLQ